MDFLKFKEHKIPTVLAITADEQEKGLMYEKSPPPAMAFVYTRPKHNSFWMQNTPSPLDIVFCLKNKIVSICAGEPYSTKVIGGRELSDLVIEMPYGNAAKLGMSIGDEINMEYQPQSLSRILLTNSFRY
jgi:uncharacterized membrane protein (UPF0127 family)